MLGGGHLHSDFAMSTSRLSKPTTTPRVRHSRAQERKNDDDCDRFLCRVRCAVTAHHRPAPQQNSRRLQGRRPQTRSPPRASMKESTESFIHYLRAPPLFFLCYTALFSLVFTFLHTYRVPRSSVRRLPGRNVLLNRCAWRIPPAPTSGCGVRSFCCHAA
ncbi:hypothetical protein C8R47DRAFT_51628 [Mycena vitilis]|nr:hypothetical protein C8R47DRAFT_51628 [Mycena vitilis]